MANTEKALHAMNFSYMACMYGLRGDMIEVFKIIHNIYDAKASPQHMLNERANTRGNNYKLVNNTFHYNLRKHFFLHVL